MSTPILHPPVDATPTNRGLACDAPSPRAADDPPPNRVRSLTRPRGRPIRLFAAAALAAAVAACGDDPAGPTPADLGLIGDYALVRFADIALPAVVVDPADECVRLTMLSGSLTLEEPDGFSLAQRYHFASACDQPGDTVDRVFGGTFALDSADFEVEITLRPDEAAGWWPMTGGVDTPSLTLDPEIPPGDRDAAMIRGYTFEKQDDATSGS